MLSDDATDADRVQGEETTVHRRIAPGTRGDVSTNGDSVRQKEEGLLGYLIPSGRENHHRLDRF